jgi:hypothetical protein
MPLDPITGEQLSTRDYAFREKTRAILNDVMGGGKDGRDAYNILYSSDPQNHFDLSEAIRSHPEGSPQRNILERESSSMSADVGRLWASKEKNYLNQGPYMVPNQQRVNSEERSPSSDEGRFSGIRGIPSRWRKPGDIPPYVTGAWGNQLAEAANEVLPIPRADDSEDAQIAKMVSLAMHLGLGLPRSAGASTVGSFGGRQGAENIGGETLRRFERGVAAYAEGKRGQALWRETGVEPGLEGKLRFEIPDTGAKLREWPLSKDNFGFNAWRGTMGEFLEHPELYRAYPGLAATPTTVRQMPKGMPYSGASQPWGAIEARGNTQEEILRVLLHELQHGVQKREGFLRGTNPEAAMQAYGAKLEPEALIQRLKSIGYAKPENRAYARHAGEVEARNVEWRYLNPGHEQLAPSLTEDIFRQWQLRGDR